MTLKMVKKYTLTLDKEFIQYCELNNIQDIDKKAKEVFNRGFTILKYGETPSHIKGKEVTIEKEVIKEVEKIVEVTVEKLVEVPVEVIREVVREVPVEVIKEVIKEIPIEVEVIKEVKGDTKTETVIKEVPIEVIKEIIKEVPVEKIVVDTSEIERLTSENEKLTKELNTLTESLNKRFNQAKYMKNSDMNSLYDE